MDTTHVIENADQGNGEHRITDHHYLTESHMRANHPMIANHLCTIAVQIGGSMVARMNGVTYSWNAAGDQPKV